MKPLDVFVVLETSEDRGGTAVEGVYGTMGQAVTYRQRAAQRARDLLQDLGISARVAQTGTHVLGVNDKVLATFAIRRAPYLPPGENRAAGRPETPGRFANRAELERYVLMKYFDDSTGIKEIAKNAGVTCSVIERIIFLRGPDYRRQDHGEP